MAFSLANYRVFVEGTTPLLMNNGDVGCNPLNAIVKTKKTFTGKRNKTDDDLATISILEWYLGLYLDAPHSLILESDNKNIDKITFNGGKVTSLPGKVFKGAICNAGKGLRVGKGTLNSIMKPSLRVSFNCPFTFEGSPDPNDLVDKDSFFDTRPVVVNGSRVMKSRPVFPNWKANFDIAFFTDKLELQQVIDCIEIAGQVVGVCDYRPEKNGTFGTFKVDKIEEI